MVAGSDGPRAMPARPVPPQTLHLVDAIVEYASDPSARSTASLEHPGIGLRARCLPSAVSNPETSRSAVEPSIQPGDDRGTARAMSPGPIPCAAEKAGPAGR